MNPNEIEDYSHYLSLLQLKYDCETVYSLIKSLQHDGITSFGIIPYVTLTVSAVLETFSLESPEFKLSNSISIKDVRLKLKIFEDGYSKSKKMLLNIDYLQDQIFKNRLRYNSMRKWNLNFNLGIYTDEYKHVVGNTQYNYYILQDNRFLKQSINKVAEAYANSPDNFDLNEQLGNECYKYAYKCGQIITSARSALKNFDVPVSVMTNSNFVNYYYADYNTNKKSSIFPTGEDGKATILYLLHILSTINFLLYVLNYYEKDDYGWWLKINYVTYYYTIQKLKDLQQHLIQNKLITKDFIKYFNEIKIDNNPYINVIFRNYIMHSKLIDRNGNFIIKLTDLDRRKPLFGLVETCFNGMSYKDLKLSIISEMVHISNILTKWLNIESLQIKPIK